MKRLLKSKHGMTLMEILVALSLLLIIIVGTTPVMLQAYNGLYTAGEKTQATYKAKSEIEEKLATRNSRDVYNPGFTVNFNNLGEVATINGRRAVSSLYGSLETLFTNARVRVAVISSKTVNDDYAGDGYHEVVLQTTNLDFGTTDPAVAQSHLSINNTATIADGGKKIDDKGNESEDGSLKLIDITFVIPDKSETEIEQIYSYHKGNLANVGGLSVDPLTGRITVKINGFDFTQSPIQIYVAYLDENNKRQTTETYLYVDTPTIIAAGETNDYDYYTSPGIEVKSVSTEDGDEIIKTETESFALYGRTMSIDEIAFKDVVDGEMQGEDITILSGVSKIPDNTIIRSVNWITEDETTGIGSYYVMTGTNGAIYRTYSFTGSNTDLTSIIKPADKVFNITERLSSKTIYPALWGGDQSQQFGYSTAKEDMGYGGGDWCWYTEDVDNNGFADPRSIAYSTSAKFAYYYNGYGQQYSYDTQRSRKISYILTEVGHAMRLGGVMNDVDDFGENYNKIWERFPSNSLRGDNYTWWYDDTSDNTGKTCPVYGEGGTGANSNSDRGFAQLRVKYLTTLSSTFIQENERAKEDDEYSDVRFLNSSADNAKITITDAVYIPSSGVSGDTVTGKMYYVGTVAAYAYVTQMDNVNSGDDNWLSSFKIGDDKFGWRTGYLILGNDDSTATSVYKFASPKPASTDGNDNIYKDPYHALKKNKTQVSGAGISTSDTKAKNFFVYRNTDSHTDAIGKLFNDLLFTMGYSSSREMMYSEIVYGKVNDSMYEAYKSYEPYYFLSHYGDTTKTHLPNLYMSRGKSNYVSAVGVDNNAKYFNSVDNDYYNVWFPGEMYNVTTLATKEGVTVGVGYAVAGSAYQFVDVNEDSNTSTGLGGIYNDGVLTCLVGGSDTSMASLLYYKDNVSFDDYSLTNGSLSYNYTNCDGTNYSGDDSNKDDYKLLVKGYGTHSRDSVQFTAVDIGVQYTGTSVEKATFYAYYADNKGRVFRSKIATRTTNMPSDYDPEDEETNATYPRSTPVKVDYISDIIVQQGDSRLANDNNIGYMEQLHCHDGAGERTTCTFDWLFSKITTIKVEGNYLLVSGHPNQANAETINAFGIPIVVGKIDETTGEINQWNIACLETTNATKYNVEDMFIRDGRVYVAGTCEALSSTNPGFMAVLTLSQVEPNFRASNLQTEATKYPLVDVQVPDKLYAISGK